MIQYLMKTTVNGRYTTIALQNITTNIERRVDDNDVWIIFCCLLY